MIEELLKLVVSTIIHILIKYQIRSPWKEQNIIKFVKSNFKKEDKTCFDERVSVFIRLSFHLWQSSSSDVSNAILSKIERTRTLIFEHRTNSNVFILKQSNWNTLILASNEQTLNFELTSTHYYAFLIFPTHLFSVNHQLFFYSSNGE